MRADIGLVETLMVCDDCIYFNEGWLDSFDCYYSEEEAAAKIKHIESCFFKYHKESWDEGIEITSFTTDSENYNEFSTHRCEMCGSRLAGHRRGLDVLGFQKRSNV